MKTFLVLAIFSVFSFGISDKPQIINLGNAGEPRDLDPAITTGVPEFHILQNLFEGLVDRDPKTLKVIPGAAESWKISPDGKTYTFTIRRNAKWSNGDPVTAQDFVYSIQRLLSPKLASEYAYQAYYLVNGKKFNSGEEKDFSKVGIKAKNDQTLVITLEKPVPFFISLMFHHSFYPVHKATVEKFGQRWTRPENMVSNGAFKLDKWEMNKVISLVPNLHYWNKGIVTLTRANFLPVDKTDTEEKMFRAKELDKTETLPNDKIASWKADPSKSLHMHPYLGTYFFYLNTKKPPLDNVNVRRALNYAIDRERLIKYVTKGGQMAAQCFTPPGIAGYKPPMVLPKDGSGIAKAKKFLADAGYPGGKGFPKIEILHNNDTNHRKIAEAIQQMWKENLGITVGINNQEWKVFLDNLQTFNYQVGRMGWIADYPDPNTYLDLWVTDGGNNKPQYSNKKYDELIAKAAKEKNSQKRFEHFYNAEKIILDELPILPLYIYTRIYLLSPKVKGWHDNIEDIHLLKHVYLD